MAQQVHVALGEPLTLQHLLHSFHVEGLSSPLPVAKDLRNPELVLTQRGLGHLP